MATSETTPRTPPTPTPATTIESDAHKRRVEDLDLDIDPSLLKCLPSSFPPQLLPQLLPTLQNPPPTPHPPPFEFALIDSPPPPQTRYKTISSRDLSANSELFVIPHILQFNHPTLPKQLETTANLKSYLSTILDVTVADDDDNNNLLLIDNIYSHVHTIPNPALDTYTTFTLESEIGLSIPHSFAPNLKSFIIEYPPNGPPDSKKYYTILYALTDIPSNSLLTRDLINFPENTLQAQLNYLRLLPPQTQKPYYSNLNIPPLPPQPTVSSQILPSPPIHWQGTPLKPPILIYTDDPSLLKPTYGLPPSHPLITLTTNPSQIPKSHVLYLTDHTLSDGSSELRKVGKILNQFHFDGMIVSKEHLKKSCEGLEVIPESWDLSESWDFKNFVEDIILNDILNYSTTKSTYILKRPRSRQSIDYPITSSLSCSLAHLLSSTRLASKYIMRPDLVNSRKYDIRFYIFVKSLKPLKLSRAELFTVRSANKPYEEDNVEDFQTHFTTMR